MTTRKIPDRIKETYRALRQKSTKTEKILWEELRNRKLKWKKFLRQYPTYVFTENNWFDRYIIPDFVCKEEKVVIELDWNIHNLKEIYLLDKAKEELLLANWYKIIRFKNEEIYNELEKVIRKIAASLS